MTITENTPTVFICENEISKVSPEEEIQSNKSDLILSTLSTLLENQDNQQMAKFETMLDAAVLEFIKTPTQCASCSKKKIILFLIMIYSVLLKKLNNLIV